MNTSDIPALSLAYDKIADAGKDNVTFRGIYFELDKPLEVILGFQADLNAGASEQEFRASKVKLIRFGVETGIRNVLSRNESKDQPVFDIHGRPLPAKPIKGLYIQDGKKYLNK